MGLLIPEIRQIKASALAQQSATCSDKGPARKQGGRNLTLPIASLGENAHWKTLEDDAGAKDIFWEQGMKRGNNRRRAQHFILFSEVRGASQAGFPGVAHWKRVMETQNIFEELSNSL